MDWISWTNCPPPNVLILIRGERYTNNSGECWHETLYPSELPPEFNIASVQWKLTGIGREQLQLKPVQLLAALPVAKV